MVYYFVFFNKINDYFTFYAPYDHFFLFLSVLTETIQLIMVLTYHKLFCFYFFRLENHYVMSGIPRFTGSLRAFAGVASSNTEDTYVQQRLNEELKWKKKNKSSTTTFSWNDLEKLTEKATDPIKV